jgi:hypothetical protein
LELITLNLNFKNNYKLAIMGLYHVESQVNSKSDTFFDLLAAKADKYHAISDNVIILGDLNHNIHDVA